MKNSESVLNVYRVPRRGGLGNLERVFPAPTWQVGEEGGGNFLRFQLTLDDEKEEGLHRNNAREG